MLHNTAKLRSYKSERGTTIRFRADQRLPTAQYWPTGAIPGEGMVFATACGPVPEYDAGREMLLRLRAAHDEQCIVDRDLRAAAIKEIMERRESEHETTADEILADCEPVYLAKHADAGDDYMMWIDSQFTVRIPLSAPQVWARDYSMDMDRLESALAEVWESELADETAVRVAPAPIARKPVTPQVTPAWRTNMSGPRKPAGSSTFNAARSAMLASLQDAAD